MRKNLIYRSKLSLGNQKMLLLMFSTGATARASARALGLNRNTTARIFRIFRLKIALNRIKIAPFSGRCEIDECYLSGGVGGRRIARQGRSLLGKFAIVGVAQRNEDGTRRLHVERLPKINALTLSNFALENIEKGAEVNTDQLPAYKLAALGYVHKKVNHSLVFKNFKTGACTNNIESAWSGLRRHFNRFCGGWRHNLELWLKELEMRFECGVENFQKNLLRLVKKDSFAQSKRKV